MIESCIRPAPDTPVPAHPAYYALLVDARARLDADPEAALEMTRRAGAHPPLAARAHRLAAHALRRLDREEEAQAESLAAVAAAVHDEAMIRAAGALADNDLPTAERLLKGQLRADPSDVAAMRMLAELAGRLGRYRDAEALLRRALALAPGFLAARSNLAMVLHKTARAAEAIAELDEIARIDPADMASANLRAAALGRIGEYDEALCLYEQVLGRWGDHPRIWMSYAHMLKTVGRRDESVAAYRHALALQPGLGEAWWSLANLKTVRFGADDVAAMAAALEDARLTEEDRFHLHFALGKAHDDAGRADTAFTHYAEGNRQRRALIDYDADDTHAQVERSRALLTPALMSRFADAGCPAADPIFIVGMPRAGSTLIEQILASHSAIEGTMELPDLPMLEARAKADHGGLANIPPAAARAMGEDYLARTRVHRKSGKPFFIDKLPNNWMQVGFIRMILPRARIIDARRHPLDCCFSNFRQHYARGQGFSYALGDIARYYGDYVTLMDHFDRAAPGLVHRVIHERLIDDVEGEVRRLLAFIGVDFEAACLAFHSNRRAVQTASSEQVRRPINRDGIGQWQRYSKYLQPIKDELSQIIEEYPYKI